MIVPSEAVGAARPWSPHHLRLHRHLLRRPGLLPQGAALLVAVSGGQDSMALTALLRDLRSLHQWTLQLWHGDHRWRPEAGDQAEALAAWARAQELPLQVDRAESLPAAEAAARSWRYRCLAQAARSLGCTHVVTGHTASDRAETVLLNLARGSHRRGLGSLRACRSLGVNFLEENSLQSSGGGVLSHPPVGADAPEGEPWLVRPLLIFSREDTARFCREQSLPVWHDSSNDDRRFRRNRLRAEVLPVLEALHPGASHRISAQAERLAEELDQGEELLDLALRALGPPEVLERRGLTGLSQANQRRLLHRWLERKLGQAPTATALDGLLARLPQRRGPGRYALAAGWQLGWDATTLFLIPPDDSHG